MLLEHNTIKLENNKIKTKFGNFKKHILNACSWVNAEIIMKMKKFYNE